MLKRVINLGSLALSLIIVELKMLPGEAPAATKFLLSKLHGAIRVDGSRIEIEDQQGVDVKLLLHKFLHGEGLSGYRVLSESGTVRIVPDDRPSPEERPENSKIKWVPPFPPLSTERLPLMDVVCPNYASDRLELPRKLKNEKR